MIEQITKRLRRSGNTGLFHDSRKDVLTITEHSNILQEKINELVSAVNRQDKEIKELKEAAKNET
ncbi:hypothetical protein [Proteiniclasticum ruminis]|uniref:Uncharacterized protein n=1 Tax=Proteiniclasticum ruminis TaxID=398199 RepID=A0A1I4ZLL6_9CLOT|nr:hypothetical protein [Proteiniclasticum ruminis]SFN50860.1 hypothetical protein SAMN04488695_10236 [Proteiniclasticum ruminis]